MIHDLNLLASLVRKPVREVQATTRRLRSSTADLACALLTFDDGTTANITASRIAQQKIRETVSLSPTASSPSI